MVLDSSAIVAILAAEPEAYSIADAIKTSRIRRISAASLLELAIVLEARFPGTGSGKLDDFLAFANVRIEPFTEEQARVAQMAYRRYGKGRHPAGLNMGDCFAYALAKVLDEPLLFKGNDFSQTDIRILPYGADAHS